MWRCAGGSYLFHSDDYKMAWQMHLPMIKTMRLNTIRLAFRFHFDNVSTADVLDHAKLEWIVDFLAKNNIKTILDNHGAMGFGSKALIDAWKRLASVYRDDTRIAAYELFNEPYFGTWDPMIRTKRDAAQAYSNLTKEIRKIDPDHILIWQCDGYYVPRLEDLIGYLEPNVVLTAHRWWTYWNQEFETWTPEQLANMTLGYLSDIREKYQLPLWLGEFGTHPPYDSTNPEWLLTQQLLLRCEESVIGWSLWMGATNISRPWDQYLAFFPLSANNPTLIHHTLQADSKKLVDYVVDQRDLEFLSYYRIEMWHDKDYVTFKSGVNVLLITTHRLSDNTLEVANKTQINITEQTTICNEENTTSTEDWNSVIYLAP
jgi:hypothetical protein